MYKYANTLMGNFRDADLKYSTRNCLKVLKVYNYIVHERFRFYDKYPMLRIILRLRFVESLGIVSLTVQSRP